MREEFRKKEKQKNNQASDKKQKNSSFWDEQYIKKAEEMERELFADGGTDAYDPTDEEEARSYQDLINRLKADGIYQEDETEPDTKRKIIPLHRKIHFGKVAGVAILCCACIFAASMTSEANRNYFVKGVRYLAGDDTRIVVDNDEINEKANTEEFEAIEDIENQLGIDMPEFYYRPAGMEICGYEINKTADIARIEYAYKDNIIAFIIDKQSAKTASKIVSAQGNKKEDVFIGQEGLPIIIEKIQEEQDTMPSYTAFWEKDNVSYCLSGKLEKEEIKKIFEDMVL